MKTLLAVMTLVVILAFGARFIQTTVQEKARRADIDRRIEFLRSCHQTGKLLAECALEVCPQGDDSKFCLALWTDSKLAHDMNEEVLAHTKAPVARKAMKSVMTEGDAVGRALDKIK